jgi:hypothetical protein
MLFCRTGGADMFSRPIAVVLSLAFLATSSAPAEVTRANRDPDGLVVHEWGTFTSIADVEGLPLVWAALHFQSDLPCFVHRSREIPKNALWGTVRMETPVVYFYSAQQTTVDVGIRFNQGMITEWFPRADVPSRPGPMNLGAPDFYRTMKWENVRVTPGESDELPTESAKSHYYAARATDAAAVEAGSQKEKFLFYRGVGRFPLPLTARAEADGRVSVKPAQRLQPIGTAILFTRHDGQIGYRVARGIDAETLLEMPEVGASFTRLRSELEQILIEEGLFAKEASAMVETWRDSWFEEGTRLFYVVPRPSIDAVLPLDVKPRPTAVARVFVGRVELITPIMVDRVRQAMLREDAAVLARHGRFLQPIVDRLIAADRPRVDWARIEKTTRAAQQLNARGNAATCR